MKCRRCGSEMYRYVGSDGSAKTTCTGCSQYVECAKCSSLTCGDTKCLKCYNRQKSNVVPGAIVPDDQEG